MTYTNVRLVDPPAGDPFARYAVAYTNDNGIDKTLPFNTKQALIGFFQRHGLLAEALSASLAIKETSHA